MGACLVMCVLHAALGETTYCRCSKFMCGDGRHYSLGDKGDGVCVPPQCVAKYGADSPEMCKDATGAGLYGGGGWTCSGTCGSDQLSITNAPMSNQIHTNPPMGALVSLI